MIVKLSNPRMDSHFIKYQFNKLYKITLVFNNLRTNTKIILSQNEIRKIIHTLQVIFSANGITNDKLSGIDNHSTL